jgi:putative transposase
VLLGRLRCRVGLSGLVKGVGESAGRSEDAIRCGLFKKVSGGLRRILVSRDTTLNHRRYVLYDRDRKYCEGFREVIRAGGIEPIALPARSPNLNAYAERWVRSVKEECLSKLILLGEGSLRRVLSHYEGHYHEERNHQGKDNLLLFPLQTPAVPGKQEQVRCRERLGGLLKYYERKAA